jgi:hypothetical protein
MTAVGHPSGLPEQLEIMQVDSPGLVAGVEVELRRSGDDLVAGE